jgi:hypothetical protein
LTPLSCRVHPLLPERIERAAAVTVGRLEVLGEGFVLHGGPP